MQVRHSGVPSRVALLIDGSTPGSLESQTQLLGFSPDIYSPDYRLVNESLLVHAAAMGVFILPWTVNTRRDMFSLISLGVRGFITDYPNVGVEVLQDVGLAY